MSTPFPASDHFDGKHFFTPGAPRMAGFRNVLQWWFGKNPATASASATASMLRAVWPKWVEITPRPPPPRPAAGSQDIVATWINHSTFLLQPAEANILFDPVFTRCCGPFGKIGAKRVHAPGIALDALPRIDAVCLSHDHYDHCDIQSLRRIARRDNPVGITPLGNGSLLRRAGFARENIIELDWWQTCELSASSGTESQSKIQNPKSKIPVTLTPAQHWSKRLTSRRNRRLWGGFFITLPAPANSPAPAAPPVPSVPSVPCVPFVPSPRTVYFVGDTGYHATIFRDIAARLGPPDLAMLPIGAYEPRWFMHPQHCNPVEAVRIHRDLRARQSVAMHWGAFRLTDEARDEPPRALAAALREAGLPPEVFKVLEPGESLTVL